MNHLHLSYLEQVIEFIEDDHKPLAARYGYIAREIAFKHVFHLKGTDPTRLRRCKSCQAPITSSNIKSLKGHIHIKCEICGSRRNYKFGSKDKIKQSNTSVSSEREPEVDEDSNSVERMAEQQN